MLRLRVCKNVNICSSYCMQFHTTKLLIIEPLFFELVNVNNSVKHTPQTSLIFLTRNKGYRIVRPLTAGELAIVACIPVNENNCKKGHYI